MNLKFSLKDFNVAELTMSLSNEFHIGTTLIEKKFCLRVVLKFGSFNLKLCPLVLLLLSRIKKDLKSKAISLCIILKHRIISAHNLLNSRLGSAQAANLSL